MKFLIFTETSRRDVLIRNTAIVGVKDDKENACTVMLDGGHFIRILLPAETVRNIVMDSFKCSIK
jgi:hypothetical protein